MLHTLGILSRRNTCSEKDATVVGYVKAAGGILIAKTNVPELNLWVESRNKIYGQTNNPYNTTRTVGGSSGGEGAIITACGSPISIGSDIGGSTRMPACFNGLFGYKPSEGRYYQRYYIHPLLFGYQLLSLILTSVIDNNVSVCRCQQE